MSDTEDRKWDLRKKIFNRVWLMPEVYSTELEHEHSLEQSRCWRPYKLERPFRVLRLHDDALRQQLRVEFPGPQ